MDINDIRRKNLRRLAADYRTRADFARAIGRSEQQLYYLIGPKASKAIGDRIARDVEKKLGQERGSLDVLPEGSCLQVGQGLDIELLQDCIERIEQACEEMGITMPPAKKAQAVALAYSATQASGQDSVVSVDFIVRTVSR